ncbi:Nucleotide-binding universal stress protein, UspA family [Marinobacter persicus]|uniref:Nucleotide-binding universal stress protein, UspA family n=1 Tax=Marinobacter persicus TaxID=930118 RepID=A0A1I3RU81_9GAMM|nr:universal stress protein [Marinobacter persicus]GHD44265.1 universal stress protein A [Marinobacter persicus]SFJ48766.1 Nucleotide-binding universal stress protein, UspA family [Marinobacter persicus]
MLQIVSCIDDSRAAPAVCDYGAWASRHTQAPLMLLHVLDEEKYPSEPDLAGNIGLGSREQLLDELAELDRKRAKLAREHGHHLLDKAEERVQQSGLTEAVKRQRHGTLVEAIQALEKDTRLFVMGLHGESSSDRDLHPGGQLETVIRSAHRPILLVPDEYTDPKSAMVAFDGSEAAFKGVELISTSPVLKGMPLHLVMVGADTADRWEQLKKAEKMLAGLDVEITLAIRAGDVEPALHQYQQEHDIDLLVMGAYGRSRIREFFVGSNTTNMLKTADKPLVILR